MKAKKQELVKSVLKWLNKRNDLYTSYNKEELQDLADRFIDHHDSKKKSKFGSDNEIVKLKEEPKTILCDKDTVKYYKQKALKQKQNIKEIKVGSFVESYGTGIKPTPIGLVCDISETKTYCTVFYFGSGIATTKIEHLKLLPND